MNRGDPLQYPETEKEEAEKLLKFLSREAARRERAAINGIKKLSIIVDDEEKKNLDLTHADSVQFIVNETVEGGSHLVKAYSEDDEGILLLATVLLDRSEIKRSLAKRFFGRKKYSVLDGKQKVELAVEFSENAEGEGKFVIDVACREVLVKESLRSISFRQLVKLSRQQVALSVIVATMALTVTGLIIENTQLHTQLENARMERQAESASLRQQEQELHRQIDDQRTRIEQLEKQLNQDREIAALKYPEPTITTFILNPDLDLGRESSGETGRLKKQINIANTRRIRLQLNFESKEKYERYMVVLTPERETKEILRKSILPARTQPNGKTVLNIPSNIFTEGDYRLTLKGVIAGVEDEEIESYAFTIVKK